MIFKHIISRALQSMMSEMPELICGESKVEKRKKFEF